MPRYSTERRGQVPAAALMERDAASYLGLSRSYLRQARMGSRGPAYVRVGRAIRYRVADLDAWFDSHRITPSAA